MTGIEYEKSPEAKFTISVVLTGSNFVTSGAVAPPVSA